MTLAHVNLAFDIELDVDTLSALLLLKRAVAAQPEPTAAAEKPAEAAQAAPPAPRSARVARAGQTNGATAPPAGAGTTPIPEQTATAAAAPAPAPAAASAPRIPSEEELRPLLSRMAAVHPDKVKGVTDMLEKVGGHKRLVECPVDMWPAIKQACDDAIAAAGG